MTKTRNLSDLLDSNGDVKSTALDNVPASNDASALTTGTLPNDRLSAVPNSALANSSITINGTATALGGSATINTDLINDTTPQLGGNLDCNTFDISFGDNEKARFGNADDLQIYHNGTNSVIDEQGAGQLLVRSNGDGIFFQNGDSTASIANFRVGTSNEFYYNGVKKLETTSAGATVTGTLTATSFSGDGSGLTGISGGKVLQVVTATKTSAQSTSSSSFTDITGLSASITPSSTSSKILIQYVTNMGVEVGTNRGAIQLVRGTTAIAIGDTASNRARVTATAYGGNTDDAENLAGSWLDSPSTTSATTYKLQCRTTGVGSIHINRSANDADNSNQFRTSSSIILMEIGA